MSINGRIVGYDPGGNGAHGVAELEIEQSRCVRATVLSLGTAEDVLRWTLRSNNLVGLGVDTLAAWTQDRRGGEQPISFSESDTRIFNKALFPPMAYMDQWELTAWLCQFHYAAQNLIYQYLKLTQKSFTGRWKTRSTITSHKPTRWTWLYHTGSV